MAIALIATASNRAKAAIALPRTTSANVRAKGRATSAIVVATTAAVKVTIKNGTSLPFVSPDKALIKAPVLKDLNHESMGCLSLENAERKPMSGTKIAAAIPK